MNLKSFLIVLTVAMGIGILTIMFKNRPQERLVTESIPVSQLSFDEKIAKIPYETATFGMG